MPKLKTRKGVVKRFKLTATGKVKRRRAYGRHLMTDKTSKRKRSLRRGALASPPDAKRIRKMMQGT